MMRIMRSMMGVPLLLLLAAPLAGDADRRDDYAVRELAHELENQAYRALRRAENRRHHYTRGENRGLRALHELSAEAAHFHDQVERHWRDPRHTVADFRALEDAFYRAARWMERAHVDRRVERDFRKVARTFDELAYHVYGRRHARGDWRHGRDGVGYYGDVLFGDHDETRVRGRVGYKEGRVRVDVGVRTERGRFRVRGGAGS